MHITYHTSRRLNNGQKDRSLSAALWWLVVGLIAGFLASLVMRGGGYGIVGDIIVSLVGALIGGFLASLVGIGAGRIDRNDHHRLYWRMYPDCNLARCFGWLWAPTYIVSR